MMFGFILLLIVAYCMFNSSGFGRACCMNHHPHGDSSLNLLNERYARGEINREEYLERQQELSGKNS
ncbi:SHOCT domain-containing protein [Desulfosporosinus sp. BG]|uniref:SHOCT domain-containing protein n=1 Tax=Desulfosporosinus sp. BG TaxID=1633135 RepID=UPI00083AD3AC|nr:SHOCT domain-containing protein [Desulfosporosinus sp. BG]ODA40102.1 hypothetical protein DSBG_3136 [Desulfosporosinus sp. BG]